MTFPSPSGMEAAVSRGTDGALRPTRGHHFALALGGGGWGCSPKNKRSEDGWAAAIIIILLEARSLLVLESTSTPRLKGAYGWAVVLTVH